jgi:DNA ligase-1
MQKTFFAPLRRHLLVVGGAAFLPALALARSRAPAVAGETIAAPLLAVVYSGQVDPALCLVSEKYDGVRAVWDGRVLRHRSGRVVSAPASFVKALPNEAVDGELWLGRGHFDEVSAIVRKAEPREGEWAQVRYMAFEMPGGSGRFADRADRLATIAARSPASPLEAAPQMRIADRAALQRRLDETVRGGGEGLMLHLASAPAQNGRSDALMKLKPHLDAEAVVVGLRAGAGKYGGQVGALVVEAPDGRRFLVGSGLTDALRRDPPPIGAAITYRYRDLTSTGLPRFATYLRLHEAL